MLYSKQHIRSLFLVRKTLITLALCIFAGQIIFSASSENVLSNLFALTAFVAGCLVVFNRSNNTIGSALSATVVFLMIFANSLAPMLGTLLEGHPITETLIVPVETFAHRLIFACCLLIAHYLSCSPSTIYIRLAISRIGKMLSTKVTIPAKTLWVVGLIGLFSVFLKFLHPPEIVVKLLDGFAYLMQAPFLMLLPPYYNKALIKKNTVWLILFFLLQVAFSFVYNSRMAMVLPVGIVGAGWLLTVLTGQTIVTNKSIRKGIIRGLVGIALIGQFADLSTAILIEREYRDTRSAGEQLKATFNRFFDKKAIADYHADQLELLKGGSAEQDWQENYVRNPFLARVIQVKFDDNCFYRLAAFSQGDFDALRELTLNRIIVQIPQPLLDLFSINIDKRQVNALSIGDEIDLLATGADIGGFKTGSIPTHAFALFRWWYPLILTILYYLIFSIYHGFFTPFSTRSIKLSQIPTLALLLTFTIYVDISLDGVDALVGSLFRGIIQRILIFAITLWIVKKLSFPVDIFKTRRASRKQNLQLSKTIR